MTPEIWAEIRRLFHVEKISGREIAEQLRVDRKTVYRALKHDHAPPPPSRARPSLLDSFQKDIDEILAQTPRITAVRLQEELERRGFAGKYTIVRTFLAARREEHQKEAFVRRVFHPGEAAEVDWMKCGSLSVEGRLRHISAFVMTLCYSRMIYLEFCFSEAFEEFLRCHVNAFAFFGGCARKIFYDFAPGSKIVVMRPARFCACTRSPRRFGGRSPFIWEHNAHKEFSQASRDSSFFQTGLRRDAREASKGGSHRRIAASFARMVISA